MKYRLIAVPDQHSCRQMELLQKDGVRKNKKLRYLNPISISLGIIDSGDVQKLKLLLDDLVKNMKYFKINCKEDLFFNEISSIIELPIENMGYIKRLYRILNDYLELNGFSLSKTDFNKDLSIPLLYIPTTRNIRAANFTPTIDYCKYRYKKYSKPWFKIEKIELRKLSESRKDAAIVSIDLKSF